MTSLVLTTLALAASVAASVITLVGLRRGKRLAQTAERNAARAERDLARVEQLGQGRQP